MCVVSPHDMICMICTIDLCPCGLTYEIVGATQVVVPYCDLQSLTDQFRERDLIKELL